jgi:hypothetical protein
VIVSTAYNMDGSVVSRTRAMVEANRAQFSITSTPGEGTLVEIIFPPTRVLAD